MKGQKATIANYEGNPSCI